MSEAYGSPPTTDVSPGSEQTHITVPISEDTSSTSSCVQASPLVPGEGSSEVSEEDPIWIVRLDNSDYPFFYPGTRRINTTKRRKSLRRENRRGVTGDCSRTETALLQPPPRLDTPAALICRRVSDQSAGHRRVETDNDDFKAPKLMQPPPGFDGPAAYTCNNVPAKFAGYLPGWY